MSQEGSGAEARAGETDESSVSLPSPRQAARDPLAFGASLLEMTKLADSAEKAKEYSRAIGLYKKLARVVPNRAIAHSKLCALYELTQQNELALASCRTATGLSGAKARDFSRLGQLILGPVGKALAPKDIAGIDAVVQHLDQTQSQQLAAATLGCDLALRLELDARMRGCAQRMAHLLPPTDPRLVAYRFSYRLLRGDFERASQELVEAQAAGLDAQAIVLMKQRLKDARETPGFRLWWGALAVAATMALVLVFKKKGTESTPALSLKAKSQRGVVGTSEAAKG